MKIFKHIPIKEARAIARLEQKRAAICAKLVGGLTCRHYAGSQTKAAFACSVGHNFEARVADVADGKTTCPVCKASARHDKSKSVSTDTALALAILISDDVKTRVDCLVETFTAQLETAMDNIAYAKNAQAVELFNAKHSETDREFIERMGRKDAENRGVPAQKPQKPVKAGPKSNRGRKPSTLRPTAEVLPDRVSEMLEVLGVQVCDEMIAKSTAAANLRCLDCSFVWSDAPSTVAERKRGCPKCAHHVEIITCERCNFTAVYAAGKIRYDAMLAARKVLKETLSELPYIQPTAPCPECGADVAMQERSNAGKTAAYMARVAAADELYIRFRNEDFEQAKAAFSAAASADLFMPTVLIKQPKRSYRQRLLAKRVTGAKKTPER